MNVAPARCARGSSRARRVRMVSAAISLPCPAIAAASASVLPPAPAHRSTTVIPGCASQSAAIHWLPASCTSTSPSVQTGCCSIGQPSGRRSASDKPGMGAASGSKGATSAGAALRRLTRRSTGARPSSAPCSTGAASSGCSQAGTAPASAPASPGSIGSGAWGDPSNKVARSGWSCARPIIAARPVSGRSPARRIAS